MRLILDIFGRLHVTGHQMEHVWCNGFRKYGLYQSLFYLHLSWTFKITVTDTNSTATSEVSDSNITNVFTFHKGLCCYKVSRKFCCFKCILCNWEIGYWKPSSDVSMGSTPDSEVHGANMGPTWVLSAPDGPHVGPMNLAIRDHINIET